MAASALTTTATKAAGSATTSRSAPTTSTPSSGTTSTHLLAGPDLIRAEITKRLEQAGSSDPVTRQRTQLELALAAASTAAMIQAYSEQLITIDELRARMPYLRAKEASLRSQIDAAGAQAADRDAYLKLACDMNDLDVSCGRGWRSSGGDRRRG